MAWNLKCTSYYMKLWLCLLTSLDDFHSNFKIAFFIPSHTIRIEILCLISHFDCRIIMTVALCMRLPFEARFPLKFSVSISHGSASHSQQAHICIHHYDFHRFSARVRAELTLSFAFGKWPTSGLACPGHFYCRSIWKRAMDGGNGIGNGSHGIDGHRPGAEANEVVAVVSTW